MTPEETLAILRRMHSNLVGAVAKRSREEKRALARAIELLEAACQPAEATVS